MVYLNLLDKLSIKYIKNHPIKKHTTFKVGGKALLYVIPKTLRELQHAIEIFNTYSVKYKILGNGSNILVSDKGYEGAIISTKELNFIRFNNNSVTCACGTNINTIIKLCERSGLSGLENLYGIPATIGGALVMNASAFGVNVSDRLISVLTIYNGKITRFYKKDCCFSYRKSKFSTGKYALLTATFDLDYKDQKSISENIKNVIEFRKNNQPTCRSCGSVFKNTGFAPAGLLIEKCGLKGYSVGNACVSNIHANFINAKDGCTANDIYYLIQDVKKKVKKKFNVTLFEEVEYLGEF